MKKKPASGKDSLVQELARIAVQQLRGDAGATPHEWSALRLLMDNAIVSMALNAAGQQIVDMIGKKHARQTLKPKPFVPLKRAAQSEPPKRKWPTREEILDKMKSGYIIHFCHGTGRTGAYVYLQPPAGMNNEGSRPPSVHWSTFNGMRDRKEIVELPRLKSDSLSRSMYGLPKA